MPLVVCDTDVLATTVWHERYVRGRCEDVVSMAAARPPALYILTGCEIPFVQDGLRDGEQVREWMHERFREVLGQQSVPWVEVAGTISERLGAALPHVEAVLASVGAARPRQDH